MNIDIEQMAGAFAENKDKAAEIRERMIEALERKEEVVLDFTGIEGATQSFIHALLAKIMREKTPLILDRIQFKGCNEHVKSIISVVTEYLQE